MTEESVLPVRATWSARTGLRVAVYVAGLAGGALVLVRLLPAISGATWTATADVVTAVPVLSLLGLVALWAAGLGALTIALSGALPGLGHRRALLLNLTGSAVANVLPLGGAAGIALNHAMTRRWGFTGRSFASYTVVTNLWDVLTKLAVPVLLLPVVMWGPAMGQAVTRLAMGAAVALPVLAVAVALVLVRPRILGRFGRRVEGVRGTAAAVVRRAWGRLTLGWAAYTALVFLLLAASLSVTGASVPLYAVLIGFCVERVATLMALTPGGIGLVEVGLAGTLMLAPGASAAGVASGVLLYRALTFGLEIPVGGLLLAGWAWWHRSRRAAPLAAGPALEAVSPATDASATEVAA